MAKGFEDTALYRYCPLASLNEVGGDPTCFGVAESMRFMRATSAGCANGRMGSRATSTHDTKRSEDVRARINVLVGNSREWERAIWRWHTLNDSLRVEMEGI